MLRAAMSFGEDYDLVRRALEAGHVVRHVALNAASPSVLHLLHGGNTSRWQHLSPGPNSTREVVACCSRQRSGLDVDERRRVKWR